MKLSGIGRIALRWHRPLQGQITTLRLSKKAGTWYASFSCVVDAPAPLPKTGSDVGGIQGSTAVRVRGRTTGQMRGVVVNLPLTEARTISTCTGPTSTT